MEIIFNMHREIESFTDVGIPQIQQQGLLGVATGFPHILAHPGELI